MDLNRGVIIGWTCLGWIRLDHTDRCNGEPGVQLTVAGCRLRKASNAQQLFDGTVFGDCAVASRNLAKCCPQELEELQARRALNALVLARAVDAAGCADLTPASDSRAILASRAEGGAGALRAQQEWCARACRARCAVARVTWHRARPAEHMARVAEASGVGSVSNRAFLDAFPSVVERHIRSRVHLRARRAACFIWSVATGAARVALTTSTGGCQVRSIATRRMARVVDQHGVDPILSCRSEFGRKERRKCADLLPA